MVVSPLQQTSPVNPPAAWIGGKRVLAKRVIALINETPHRGYCEPFVGMGGIFFRRTLTPKAEFINDRSGDVSNLFRILQRHYPQFMDMLKYQICSRKEFERLSKVDPDTLTDLERAARFIYLQRQGFGGKVTGRTFGVDYDRGSRFNLTKLAPVLEDVHERLAGVVIENLDWLDFINKYDRSGFLFYIDPPYFGNEDDYGEGLFSAVQFKLMAKRLKKLKGRFIMSINDRPQIREAFKAFDIQEVDVTYSVGGSGRMEGKAKELIIVGGKGG